MPQLPTLVPASNCPDKTCAVPIGVTHPPDCEVATCLQTGEQRLLHQHDMPETPTGIDPAVIELLTHNCGEDTWTGQLYGVAECQQYGWYVRRATADDPTEAKWVPCFPDHPGGVPDLDRLTRHATWDQTQRRWNRQLEVPGRG